MSLVFTRGYVKTKHKTRGAGGAQAETVLSNAACRRDVAIDASKENKQRQRNRKVKDGNRGGGKGQANKSTAAVKSAKHPERRRFS